ncbi:hypothetical protein ES703_115222 [subsurface metagenome]
MNRKFLAKAIADTLADFPKGGTIEILNVRTNIPTDVNAWLCKACGAVTFTQQGSGVPKLLENIDYIPDGKHCPVDKHVWIPVKRVATS